jgi:hypothetical protein
MGSLSKRTNAPGLRSGFAAGDAAVLDRFVLYRTYHGTAVSNTVQLASIAAWKDEAHVRENRRLYREKFAAFHSAVDPVLPLTMPAAAFYFWAAVPGDDTEFARDLYAAANVTVLPGSFIGREAHGVNPGRGFVRIALVSTVEESIEAANRVRDFAARHMGASRPCASRAERMSALQSVIEAAFEKRADLPRPRRRRRSRAVAEALAGLDRGELRVAESKARDWITHQWLKKACCCRFACRDNEIMQGGFTHYYDKVDSKFARFSQADFAAGGYRVVPPATARHGAFIAKNVMHDAVLREHRRLRGRGHDGRHLGDRGLVRADRQERAPVGRRGASAASSSRCRRIPPSSRTGCFIGARSEIVEGVIVGEARWSRWGSTSARAPRSTTA